MSNTSDREFYKKFFTMIAGLAVLAVGVFVVAQIVTEPVQQNENKGDMDDKSIAQRIRPVGQLRVSATPVMDKIIPTAHAASTGKSTYDASCGVCHVAGVAGAPKLGDKASWKERVAQGKDTLYEHAIKGYQGKKGMMPAKGGNASLSDADVKAAVDYMISNSK